MLDRAARLGITVQATFENGYYLATELNGSYAPLDASGHSPVYSAIGHDQADDLMLETVDALTAQGIRVEQAINEYGPGQREISVRHTDALAAADQQMKFRDTVRGVAHRHGVLASFAAKPYPDEIGSGAHVHFSLWDGDGERSLLYDPAVEGGRLRTTRGRHRSPRALTTEATARTRLPETDAELNFVVLLGLHSSRAERRSWRLWWRRPGNLAARPGARAQRTPRSSSESIDRLAERWPAQG